MTPLDEVEAQGTRVLSDVRYDMIKLLSALFFILCVSGCSIDEQKLTQARETPLSLSRHEHKFYDIEIPKELQSDIFIWLLENRKRWEPDPYVSFVPNTIMENEFVHLNIQESIVIVSVESSDKFWMQYSKKIEPIHLEWKKEIEKLIEQGNGEVREKAGEI